MKISALLLAAASLLPAPLPAFAWGVTGHQTVALIAQSQLTPHAAQVVATLLLQEPGSTLAGIATWADENRDSSNTRWHYVNFPLHDCHYLAARDCPDGACVVAQTASQMAVLNSKASAAEKLPALKFLVHLAGDIHQPLHAGFGADRGGNLFQIQYRGNGSNLHALWDNEMVGQFRLNPQALAQTILLNYAGRLQLARPDGGPVAWAEQSCTIVAGADFYPEHKVDDRYLRQFAPVVQLQLLRAGLRLAALLNTLD